MNANTTTQLQYINRDGSADLSFALAIRKQQAKRYATMLIKRALRASTAATVRTCSDVYKQIELNIYDDVNGTSLRREYELAKTAKRNNDMRSRVGLNDKLEVTDRNTTRNSYGQFVKV